MINGFNIEKAIKINYCYKMIMDNLDRSGDISHTHRIESEYSLTSGDKSTNKSVFDGIYHIGMMKYFPKKGKPIRFKSFEGKEFTSVLFNISNAENMEYISKNEVQALLQYPWEEIQGIFSKMPKLPTVGIIHAFVYDLLGIDQLLSHSVSSIDIFHNPGEMMELKFLSDMDIDFSVGLYSKDTEYSNGRTMASFLGDGMFIEREQGIIEFMCNRALFQSSNKKKENHETGGYSYYNGIIGFDYETGLMSYCRMHEMIFQTSKNKDKTKILKRFIEVKATDIEVK